MKLDNPRVGTSPELNSSLGTSNLFLANVGLYSGSGFVVNLYNYAWFIGLGISSLVYYVLMRNRS